MFVNPLVWVRQKANKLLKQKKGLYAGSLYIQPQFSSELVKDSRHDVSGAESVEAVEAVTNLKHKALCSSEHSDTNIIVKIVYFG